MIDYLTKELDKKGLFANKKKNKNQSLWLATSMQIFNALSLQGLRRLTPEDREKSMVFNRYLVKTLSPRDCKMFVMVTEDYLLLALSNLVQQEHLRR